MEIIKYNFDFFIEAFNNMKKNCKASPEDLAMIKNELNKFFADSTCKEILYTDNPDKMFFGIKIIPIFNTDDTFDYLMDDESHRISKYIVEIDSHLLNPAAMINSKELLAILIHEVSNLVGTSEPIQEARNAMNRYFAINREHLKVTKSIHYKEILAYGLKDYISKVHSMFYCSDISDLYAQSLIAAYGLSEYLASAYRKISHDNMKLYENTEISKFITFAWCLSLYKNIKIRRVGAIHTLNRAKQLTGSRLEKMEIDNVIRRIVRIDDDMMMESSGFDMVKSKIKEKLRKSRLNTLRQIDSTFYELNMQVRNVEDEDDALYLMRQINSNIAILEEYVNSGDFTHDEIEKWHQVLDKFIELRDRLSKTAVYKNSNYGLFVKYPDIVENRY